MRGACRGHREKFLKVDKETGVRKEIEKVTVMNEIEYPVNNAELQFTENDVQHCRQHGPHTEHPCCALEELSPEHATEAMRQFHVEDVTILTQEMADSGRPCRGAKGVRYPAIPLLKWLRSIAG